MKLGITSIRLAKTGGIGRYVAELAGRFAREHQVHIITGAAECDVAGATFHLRRVYSSPVSLQVASAAYAFSNEARRLKQQGIIELFHSQGAEAWGADVVTAHSCQKAAVNQLRKSRGGIYGILKPFEPRSNVVLAIERRNFSSNGCKRIISVSQGVKKEIMELYGVAEERVTAIPNGVDLDEFNPAMKAQYRRPVRERLALKDTDIMLVFTAWEFNRKGLKYIIEALPHLPADVKLVAVGGEDPISYRALAERLSVKDRVIFPGPTKNAREYYGAADAFVFPTAYEAFSLSTLEAAASGLPVIATRVNGTEELIEDGVNGYFVKREGADIADKIKTAIGVGLERMGASARKTAEGYSWDRTAKETLKVYKEALE